MDQELDLEGEKESGKDETDKNEKKDDSPASTFDEEDVKADAEEGTKSATQLSTETKLKKAEVNPRKNKDYSLIDLLCSFLDSEEELLPILCGYFAKIMQ